MYNSGMELLQIPKSIGTLKPIFELKRCTFACQSFPNDFVHNRATGGDSRCVVIHAPDEEEMSARALGGP